MKFALLLLSVFLLPIHSVAAQERPERVLMIFIDGLHPRAIESYDLENIQRLQREGAAAETGILMFPAHPTTGPYGEWHTTSFPNVSGQAGTAFLTPRPRFLQHELRRLGKTLHAAGSASYRSMNDGFDYALTSGGVSDARVVDFYMAAMRERDIVYARLMLQETGNAGRKLSAKNLSDDPWARDVFAPGSPYGATIKKADAEIGRLLRFLEETGRLETTLITVKGDGQGIGGWHQTLDPEAALTPIVFRGPGIPAGTTIPYAENIDVVPTLAALMGVDAPNEDGGAGRVLFGPKAVSGPHPRHLATINGQIRDYERLHAEAVLRAFDDPKLNVLLMELDHELLSEHQFYAPDRVMDWHEAGSLAAIVEANGWVLETLRLALEDGVYRFGAF